MRIKELLNKKKVSVSYEIFPPKQRAQLGNLMTIVRDLSELDPAFVSVTYGAMGGTSEFTLSIADEIQNGCGLTALAHLTCVAATREMVTDTVSKLKTLGIDNVLALRGDIPEDVDFPLPNQYKYASELIKHIKTLGNFCIGGACYPEGHPEAATVSADIDNLKKKVDAGCDFLTTQMFFDNNILYRFMYRIMSAGIHVPVVAGIMPVTNGKQIKRIVAISGNLLPSKFVSIVDRFGDDPGSMEQAGIAYATEQIIDLIANGVNNIHIYTMNKPQTAQRIHDNISSVIGH